MNIDNERAAFESEIANFRPNAKERNALGRYASDYIEGAWQGWLARAQSDKAVSVEFNEGDRVVWTNSYGTEFNATIQSKGIGYHIILDDGAEITTAGKLRALIAKETGK